VYNVGAFAPAADEIRTEVLRAFPTADITYRVDTKRQGIVDTWPEDVDDSAARREWGFSPKYNFESAFREYLIPEITRRYAR
jgi:nucleoside-diphosphate-sugar epimerase